MNEEQNEQIQLLLDDPYDYVRSLDLEQLLTILDSMKQLGPIDEEWTESAALRGRRLRRQGWI